MNGHLLRCRCASGPHVLTTYAPLLRQASGGWHRQRHRTAQCAFRCSGRLATHLQGEQCRKSPKGASGAFLNGFCVTTKCDSVVSPWS